jgi:hypothetical protein
MNFRLAVTLAALTALTFSGYWLYTNIPLYGLVVYDGEQWNFAAKSWSIFTSGWVFAALGVCVALVLVVPVLLWLYLTATDADHSREIETLKQDCQQQISKMKLAVNTANNQAKTAMEAAKQRFETVTAEAENRAETARQETEKAKSMQAQAVQYAQQCDLKMQEAALIAQRAIKKKNTARCMAERRKRKLERSESV